MTNGDIDTFIAAVIDRAGQEARADGSAVMEAHHLLLAIAAAHEATTQRALTAVGLDDRSIRTALDREFERSLAAAGVMAGAGGARPSVARREAPPPGASFKLALERGFRPVSRRRDLRPAHLLLGIVQAPVGTVPRALAIAGVNPADLAARIEETLATP